jgi:hypothetical protein
MDLMALKLYRMKHNVNGEKEAEQTTRLNTNWLAGGFNVIDKPLDFLGPRTQTFKGLLWWWQFFTVLLPVTC